MATIRVLAIGLVISLASLTTTTTARRATAASASPPSVWLAGTDGGVFTLGAARFRGSLGAVRLARPVIAVAARPSGDGYWLAALDGGVFTFGSAPFFGSLGAIRLASPVVDMASTPSGNGYWLVAADGGVFTFGDARFYGSLGAVHLASPISGLVPTSTGHGYWLVAADGGVFTFGDARFYGSLGGTRLTAPITALARTRDGRGYWLLALDGHVYNFGDAVARGNAVVPGFAVGIVPTASGAGYWIAGSSGVVRDFGDATPLSLPAIRLATPVVGLATPWASSSGIALVLLGLIGASSSSRTWVGAHEAALTFDDGPGAQTAQVLAVLRGRGAPAAFFTVGYEAAASPDLLRAEAAAGMSVEDHSWSHAELTTLSVAGIDSELQRGAAAVAAAIGRPPVCFRPPYGATNGTVVSEGLKLGLAQVLWNVAPGDYTRPGAAVIAARVLSAASAAHGRGVVILLHDGGGDRTQTVQALPTIIDGLRALGYSLVRLCG